MQLQVREYKLVELPILRNEARNLITYVNKQVNFSGEI